MFVLQGEDITPFVYRPGMFIHGCFFATREEAEKFKLDRLWLDLEAAEDEVNDIKSQINTMKKYQNK